MRLAVDALQIHEGNISCSIVAKELLHRLPDHMHAVVFTTDKGQEQLRSVLTQRVEVVSVLGCAPVWRRVWIQHSAVQQFARARGCVALLALQSVVGFRSLLPCVALAQNPVGAAARGARGVRRPYYKWVYVRALRAADVVVCSSVSSKVDLAALDRRRPKAKIHVVHLGVNTEGTACTRRNPLKSGMVLFVGNGLPHKQWPFAVQVFEGMGGARSGRTLVGVGPGLSDFRVPGVRVVGVLRREQVDQLYLEADVLLVPSTGETFALPVVEALVAGCPVVAMNVGIAPELSSIGGLQVLDALNADEWAMHAIALCDQGGPIEVERERLARAFSWQTCARTIWSLCEQVGNQGTAF